MITTLPKNVFLCLRAMVLSNEVTKEIAYIGKRFHSLYVQQNRAFHVSEMFSIQKRFKQEKDEKIISTKFFNLDGEKSKQVFVATIETFKEKQKSLKGHTDFIYAALKLMKEYGVHRDVEVYKKLMDVFPKKKMIAQNLFQAEFQHYYIQQECAVVLLDQMESYGIIPDSEMDDIIFAIFGKFSDPYKKYGRMNYWMKKFNNASPWPLPKFIPVDSLELAWIAMARMCSVDLTTKITKFDTETVPDAVDHTWILSGQSPQQQEMLQNLPGNGPIRVFGPYRIYLREQSVNYFVLKGDNVLPKVEVSDSNDLSALCKLLDDEQFIFPQVALTRVPTVHEQDDGIIFAICITGTSSRDSLLSWVRLLSATNPRMGEGLPVVFMQADGQFGEDLLTVARSSEGNISQHIK